MKFSVRKGFVFSHLYEVRAGDEEQIISALKAHGLPHCYKSFGIYDIIAFEEADGLDPRYLGSSCEGVTGTTALSLFSLQTEEYQSPSITDWVSDAPIIGYVTLEIDKIYYRHPPDGSSGYAVSNKIVDTLYKQCSEGNINVALYGGLGRPELVAIVRSDDITDIWKFSTLARELTELSIDENTAVDGSQNYPLFSKTTTIPAISYKNIQFTEQSINITGISGSCEASISIDCPPGFEGAIADFFSEADGYSTLGMLGANDVLIQTTRKIDTAIFTSKLFNYRRTWARHIHAPITSVTSILESRKLTKRSDISAYEIEIELAQLVPLDLLKSKAPRLANRLLAFIHKYNAILNNRQHHLVIRNFRNYMAYLSGMLSHYENQYESGGETDIYLDESSIMDALELVELGLAQRMHDGFDSPESPYSVLLPPGEGFFSSLVAIEHLIGHIFTAWSQCTTSYDRNKKWLGFPIFSDTNGFSLSHGESIFIPYDAIHDGASAKGSWLTLTHEISHTIYQRLQVPQNMERNYKNLHDCSYPLRGMNRTARIYTPVDDQLNEFFTHWFDYYHFFNKDFEQFFTSIWRSWLTLSIVQAQFEEYFFRSYIVYLLTLSDTVVEIFKTRDEEKTAQLLNLWDKHMSMLQHKFNISTHLVSQVLGVKDALIELAKRYMPIVIGFLKFKNEPFRELINKRYEGLAEHIDSIENGGVVLDDIENPYILAKEVIFRNMVLSKPSAMTALTLSLKNQVRLYTQGKDQD